MKVRTKVRAGALLENHNAKKAGIKVKTRVRSGQWNSNHSTTRVKA
jgi:hypothetical protein